MKRTSTALLATVALVIFAGCGSGEEGVSTASNNGSLRAASQAIHNSGGRADSQKSPSGHEQGRQQQSPPDLPPPTPGSRRAAPGVPTSKGGDNSIQTWGHEASAPERQAVSVLLRRYLNARAARRWAVVCRLLTPRTRREQLRFRPRAAGCAEQMRSFAREASRSSLLREAHVRVLSLRVGSHGSRDYAFLIYRRTDGVFATALIREHGDWRVLTVTPNPIG